jgi:CII-binding regulator of phage lambda lysogenization HflD
MARDDKVTLIVQELVRRTNEESRRLRNLEQKIMALEMRMQSLENTSSMRMRRVEEKTIEFEAAIKLQNDIVMKLKNNFDKLAKQTEKYARKSDIKELEKMFDLLSPISQQFVTKKEFEDFKRKVQ